MLKIGHEHPVFVITDATSALYVFSIGFLVGGDLLTQLGLSLQRLTILTFARIDRAVLTHRATLYKLRNIKSA